jgi:hypothetical protein
MAAAGFPCHTPTPLQFLEVSPFMYIRLAIFRGQRLRERERERKRERER